MKARSVPRAVFNVFLNHVMLAGEAFAALRYITSERPVLPASDEAAAYDRYTSEDLRVLFHTYEKIARKAGDRQVYIFGSPYDAEELVKMQQYGYDFPLVRELEKFAEGIPNLHFVDLLPHFWEYTQKYNMGPRAFELPCDSHWGALGHRVAAEAIEAAVWTQAADSKATP